MSDPDKPKTEYRTCPCCGANHHYSDAVAERKMGNHFESMAEYNRLQELLELRIESLSRQLNSLQLKQPPEPQDDPEGSELGPP